MKPSRVEITQDEALELVGIDGCTEALNGEAQLLDTGAKLTARGGRFFITGYAHDASDVETILESLGRH